MDHPAFERRSAYNGLSASTKWILDYKIPELLRSVEGHHHLQQFAIETIDERAVSST
jgi:hypothetical protein